MSLFPDSSLVELGPLKIKKRKFRSWKMKLPLEDSFFDMGCESWRGRNIGIKDWILVRRWHLVGYWGRWDGGVENGTVFGQYFLWFGVEVG